MTLRITKDLKTCLYEQLERVRVECNLADNILLLVVNKQHPIEDTLSFIRKELEQ